MGKLTSNILDLNGLSELIKVMKIEEYDDFFIENNYCQCKDEEGFPKDECECGFEDQRGQLYDKYVNAVEQIAEKLLNEHGLTLIKNEKKFNYRIMPQKSWRESANLIRETVNGVGYFHFNSVKEFMDSGPYTARECVLQHSHYLCRWYEVYGDYDAQYRLSGALR